jgi:hypothetical protein
MRLIKILLLLQLIISLNSCGPLANKKTGARKVEWDPDKRVAKNIAEGKGLRIFDSKRLGKTTTYEFASSNELWRATLDTIDFMPLTTANYSGGIIVTDWYSDNQNLNENIKITIRFLTNEIRSDALDLKIFYRNCDSSNKCKIIEKDGNLSKELKKEILKKAVIYQQQAKIKKDKKD